jgi:hypothetical protein
MSGKDAMAWAAAWAHLCTASAARPIYAVLDTAREPGILPLLHDRAVAYRSLFEPAAARDFAGLDPCLAPVDARATGLAKILELGWGRAWAVFVEAPLDGDSMRSALRERLWVEVPGEPAPLYFRFYDPRVLRRFLATLGTDDVARFFGPIAAFWLESADGGALLRAAPKAGGGLWVEAAGQPGVEAALV